MAKLQGDKAFRSSEIEELKRVGKETLQTAQEVSEDVEQCLAAISAELAKIPAAARESGMEEAVDDVKKSIRKGNYRQEKLRMEKALTKLETAVPQTDKKLAGQMRQLSAASDRLYHRITDLEPFLQKGKIELPADQFAAQLEECHKVWEEEEKNLEKLMKAVKAGLKGLETASCQYSADPVNLSTGNFIYDKTDLAIRGEPGLSFRRFYNALEQKKGVMGRGWVHNYELQVREEEGQVSLYLEDGKEEQYEKREDGTCRSLRGSLGVLKKTGEGWQQEGADGSCRQFDKKGAYIRYADARGKGLLLSHDENGRLSRVQEENGASFLSYAYDGEGRLIRVSDHTGRNVDLSYGEDGALSRVEGTEGTVYEYGYDREGRLNRVINGEGTVTVKNSYDSEGRTRRQAFPDGSRMKYRYLEEEEAVELTERNGAKTLYYHDSQYRNIMTVYEDGEETDAYNRNGRRTSHTDKNGNHTVYAYDGWGNLTSVTDPLGNTTRMLYNGRGKLIKLTVNGKEKIRNHYDSRGNRISTTDGEGNTTAFSYDGENRLVHIQQADGSEISITYDEKGNPITMVRADGGQIAYAYDELNRIIRTTDENGNTTSYVYDTADRIVAVTNPEGNTRTYTYNSSGMVTEIVDFDGNRITRGYNLLNKLEWETDKEGNTTHYEYDKMWNISRRILPNGGEFAYQYNRQNRLEKVTNPLGGSLFYHYDKNGNVTRVENADGEAVTYAYDELNRRISMTDAMGNESRTYYDAVGRVVREIDALGRVFDTVYDQNGNKTEESSTVNGKTTYSYDCMGRVETITDGIGRVRKYTYDICGRVQEIEDFDGRKESYVYDLKGNITCKKDSTGTEYYYIYDRMDRLTEVRNRENTLQIYTYDMTGKRLSATDVRGNRTEYHYTPNGHMDRLTDPAGNVTSYAYDSMGQLEKIFYPSEGRKRVSVYERNLAGQVTAIMDALGNTEYYTYDCYGRLTEKVDRNGQHTGYGHNAMGDVTHIRYADGKEVFLSYDPLRELKELQDWTGTTRIVKDAMGRTNQITDASGSTVTYEWETLGERTGVIYPDGQKITYRYDQYLNLKEVTAGGKTTAYLYDENGRLSGKQYANGMNSHYTYTVEGRLESLTHEDREGVCDRFYYSYDAAGICIAEERQRKDLPEESGTYGYSYDILGRLVRVEKDGMVLNDYEYDVYGNRTAERKNGEEIRYLYNDVNQLIRREGESGIQDYLYDANGNLLQVMQADRILEEYRYDSADHMVFAKTGNGIAEYGYNGFGKKIGIEVKQPETEMLASPGRTDYILDYTRDYNNLLQRKNENGTETYFWDYHLLSASFKTESNPADEKSPVRHMTYLGDQMGSPLHFCNAEGSIQESYGYDAFGEGLYIKNALSEGHTAGKEQPFGFTGYEWDTVSGFYDAQARRYDAKTGRFTSRDELKGWISRPQSQNEYAYCLGNPLSYVDRNGREQQFVSGDDYEFVGYDENGTPIFRKEEERTKEEKLKDAELLDQTYDWTADGLSVANEAGNIFMPKWIKESPRPNNIGKGTWNKKIAGELAEQAKFYSKAGKVLEKAGYVGVGIDVGIGIYNNVQEGTCWQKIVLDATVDLTISLCILVFSAALAEFVCGAVGAIIGTGVLPGWGSAIGAAIGSTLGQALLTIAIDYMLDELINNKLIYNGKSYKENLKDYLWYYICKLDQMVYGSCTVQR